MPATNETQTPWYKKWWGILLIIFSGLFLSLLFAFAFTVFKIVKTGPETPEKINLIPVSAEKMSLINGNDQFSIGTATPRISIVEFGDYACPSCKKSFPIIRELSTTRRDEIRYSFRNFPVIADYSYALALAARCAGEQGLFWPMHDQLFINQGVNSKEGVFALAQRIGADTVKFEACFDNEKYRLQIEKDISDAGALGIKGTPTFFINGIPASGSLSREKFLEIIDNLLKESNKS